jgi:hypothetical protein
MFVSRSPPSAVVVVVVVFALRGCCCLGLVVDDDDDGGCAEPNSLVPDLVISGDGASLRRTEGRGLYAALLGAVPASIVGCCSSLLYTSLQ